MGIALNVDGLKTIESNHNVATTADRLDNILKEKGMNVFARVNHAADAEKIGEMLRPTELIIFGNPQTGTPLMQSEQTVAIDLPQKMLVWQDADGMVSISYNAPDYLAQRHHINGCDELINKINTALDNIARQAAE
ncbi:MAG: DUF302 domain-containing protein [Sulfuriflexus sp.]|nr:DUF302 domain-containing protein [Sulfuriflexus sp.]